MYDVTSGVARGGGLLQVAHPGGGILDKLYVIFFLVILNNHYFAISLTC